MNKSFILLDKNNNSQEKASVIVKFSFEEKDYLVYSVEESEQNSQIFVSKIILNSEGKYFIDNVVLEEKNKLNNIVYNIVILIPTEAQKGVLFENLSNNLFDKFGVKLSLNIPEFGMQEYFRNSSVAITSKILVDAAVKLYSENLNDDNHGTTLEIPTWTAPVEATAPTPVTSNSESNASASAVSDINMQPFSVTEPVVSNIENGVSSSNINVDSNMVNATSGIVSENTVNNVVSEPNPQIEKLAIVSDPSLGLGVSQPNLGKTKKAGFANTKYIIIGTSCLVLAVAVVIVAYILIKNMQ